jgi:FMN phosphatase YigB (HAD superfamily)
VGDTISRDVLGSRNSGLAMCILIRNPSVSHRDKAFQGPDAPKADYTIDTLEEIPAIIRNFNRTGAQAQGVE